MLKNKIIAAFLFIVCLSLTACQPTQTDDTILPDEMILPEETKYKLATVELGEYVKTSQGGVSIEYPITAKLSLETSCEARYGEISVQRNDRVKKGDVLAVFEIVEDKAAMAELELQLTRAKESFAAGKKTRQTAIDNAEKQTVGLTGHELQIAKLQVEKQKIAYEQYVYQTQKSIAQIEENIAERRADAQKNTLVAPFDGVIESVAAYNPGDRVPANTTLIKMYSEETYYLTAEAGDKLRFNMDITIEAGKKGDVKEYGARVVSAPNILPLSLGETSALIQLNIPQLSPTVFKDSTKFFSNEQEVQNVLLVDRNAIYSEDGTDFVYILEDGMVQKRYVVRGLNNTEEMWILDGLSEGQSLILD